MDAENSEKSFTHDFHYLSALVQHLGAHEKWNSRTPRNIADSIGLEKNEVERVLEQYPAFFRKSSNKSSQNEPLYSLHLRYARRKVNAETNQKEAAPVDSSELSMLLTLITNMIGLEAEDKRLKTEIKNNNTKVWAAVIAAVVSSLAAIVTALVK